MSRSNLVSFVSVLVVMMYSTVASAAGVGIAPQALPSAHDVYSRPGLEGGRDLRHYSKAGPVLSRQNYDGIAGVYCFPERAEARAFILECWRSKRRGYLVINTDWYLAAPNRSDWRTHLGTVHLFIEPVRKGKWQVVWILVNCDSEIAEQITFETLQRRADTVAPRSCGKRTKSFELDFTSPGQPVRSI